MGDSSSGSGDETTATEPACARDSRACTVWVLPHGGGATWTALGGEQVGTEVAPSEPVRAAFDIEAADIAFVLTDSTYHRFDLRSQRWTEEGSRELLFPELDDADLVRGHSTPAYWITMSDPETTGVSRIILGSATQRFVYNYSLSDESFSFQSQSTDLALWPKNAPNSVPLEQVEATWSDVTNGPGWISV